MPGSPLSSSPRPLLALLAVVLVAGSLTACLPTRTGDGPGFKVVASKREPTTLVAIDGSSCEVTPDRFERVKVGDRVFCAWRSRGGMPSPRAVRSPRRSAHPSPVFATHVCEALS